LREGRLGVARPCSAVLLSIAPCLPAAKAAWHPRHCLHRVTHRLLYCLSVPQYEAKRAMRALQFRKCVKPGQRWHGH
jgi:hypothetical protein